MKGIDYREVLEFYKGKKILITGNTGFKGSWLTYILLKAGAKVIGVSLSAPTEPNLFSLVGLDKAEGLKQYDCDVRNFESLNKIFFDEAPEIVFHLAAQPIVRESYINPLLTYETNVNGTLNILECIRINKGVKSFLNVTTDKVYKNNEWEYGYRETDPLDGVDPYSNSKSCSELITHSYKESFFTEGEVRISTARAGNVIGGGDFAKDRIIPDCVRAIVSSMTESAVMKVRNPYSIRPYQHVMEPLFMYMTIAMKQYKDKKYADYYNIGPDDVDCVTTGYLVTLFCEKWNRENVQGQSKLTWENVQELNAPHEACFLKLDNGKIKRRFQWQPKLHIESAVQFTVDFCKVWLSGGDLKQEMNREIEKYLEL